MSSRREEAILRQTICVMCVYLCARMRCVCVCARTRMVTQLQAELGILNYHISTSRDKPKGFTQMSVRKHTCIDAHTQTHIHTPPPHISGTAGPLLRSSNTPAEGGWGVEVVWVGGVEEEGRAVGYGEAWIWWVTLRPRLNTNHPFSSVIGQFQAGSSNASQNAASFFVSETCSRSADQGSDRILDSTLAASRCILSSNTFH